MMRMVCGITLEFIAGTSIEDAAKESVRWALRSLDHEVAFNFNGKKLQAAKFDWKKQELTVKTPSELVDEYAGHLGKSNNK